MLFFLVVAGAQFIKRTEDKTKCPKVKAIRNFDLQEVNMTTLNYKNIN